MKLRSPRVAGAILGAVALLAAVLATRQNVSGAPAFKGGYQAVVLDNGQLYYGKVARGLGTDYPKMTDVYYVVPAADANNNKKNVLVRRGKEWHGPKETYLSARHIIMVEPVDSSSEVAKLIEEMQSQASH